MVRLRLVEWQLLRVGLSACLAVLTSVAALPAGAALAGSPPVHYTDRVAVLMYHGFERPQGGPITVTAQQFDEHLRSLTEAGFRFISAEQFRQWKAGKEPVPANAVLLTIDDGLKEVHSVALPLLRKYHVPAVAFVVYRRIDLDPNTLSSDAVKELVAAGVEVQPHTYNMHHRVIRTGDGADVAVLWVMDEAAVRLDMAQARQRHKEILGNEPDMLAYPYGSYNATLMQAARSEGIRFGFTTRTGLVSRTTPDMEIPRFNAGVRGMTGKQVVDLLQRYAPAPAAPTTQQPKPSRYVVGGGLYRSKAEALKAAQRFTRLTGYRMYVTPHPQIKTQYWVQTGKIPSQARAVELARRWGRLGIKYIVPSR